MQHFLNIPYYSALLDSSTSPSPPVTQLMNDSSMNEEILGDAARQAFLQEQLLQYTPGPPFNMAGASHGDQHVRHAAATQFVSISPHTVDPYVASGGTSPAAMLQLLTALNGDHHTYQQLLNLSAPPAPDYVGAGPATLNFFQASATDQTAHLHHADLAAAAAAQIDHNSLQLAGHGIAGPPVHCGNTSGFLSLFNLPDEMRSAAAGNLASAASPCLQLQPLELHPSLGSPPTLFQKRAALRRRHVSAVQGATSTGTSSSASSKAKLNIPPLMNTSKPVNARNSPCSFSSSHREWTTKQLSGSSSSAVAFSDPAPLGAELEQAGLSEPANGGEANFSAELDYTRQQRGLPAAADQAFSLAAEDEDNCAEALFHMHDPELQRMEAVHGGSTLMHDHTSEDDELLLLQSAGADESLQLAAASSDQHNIQDTATIPRANGRGKVKGPPAKNLMAERRRRKKLNDRLYTLRSVVPKISKMDRASILGDAIEYLKELLQRINDLHNELEASSTPATAAPMPASGFPPATPNSFTNQSSSLTPTSQTASLPANSLVKLEDCPSMTTSQLQLQSVCAAAGPGPDPSQPPKIEVRAREGRALNIHMFCGRRPGLLLAIMRALDGLGLDVQQAVISCFNGFALDVFRAEQSQEEEVAAEEIKRVLLHTATSTSASAAGSCGGSY